MASQRTVNAEPTANVWGRGVVSHRRPTIAPVACYQVEAPEKASRTQAILMSRERVSGTKRTRSWMRLVQFWTSWLTECQRPYGESTSDRPAAWFSTTIQATRFRGATIVKLSIPCIVDQRILLLYQPNVPRQILVNGKDNTSTRFGKNVQYSASTCTVLKTSCKWLNNFLFRPTDAQHIYQQLLTLLIYMFCICWS